MKSNNPIKNQIPAGLILLFLVIGFGILLSYKSSVLPFFG